MEKRITNQEKPHKPGHRGIREISIFSIPNLVTVLVTPDDFGTPEIA